MNESEGERKQTRRVESSRTKTAMPIKSNAELDRLWLFSNCLQCLRVMIQHKIDAQKSRIFYVYFSESRKQNVATVELALW